MASILIVEDNQHMHRIYAEKFRRDGFQVFDAFDGEESLDVAVREKPDVILLDLMMPKTDGFAVLQRLKDNPSAASIPVVVISNKSQPVDVERALMLGAQKFLHKGMTSLDDIVLEIRRICRVRKALLVSDRSELVGAVSGLLAGLGYLCSTSSMAVELVPRAEREHPDLIVLDAQMAGLRFHVIMQLLQAGAKTRTIPVVLLGEAQTGAATRAYGQLVGQVAVPVQPAQFEQAVRLCANGRAQAVSG